MKIIRVKLTINGRCVLKALFNNYPTFKELKEYLAIYNDRRLEKKEALDALEQSPWVFTNYPHKGVRWHLHKFKALLGQLDMEEVRVTECEGFDPYRTSEKMEELV